MGTPPYLLISAVQDFRGLDLGDDRGARMVLEDVAGVNDQQLVAPEDAPPAVDDADAVGVAVQADAQVGPGLLHLGDQVLQVLDHGGVGMVVGEAAVHVAEDAG